MPAKKRRSYPGLIDLLRKEPHRFEFFQAVRLLLARHRRDSNDAAENVLGQHIRFRNSVSLAFPPSEIESLEFSSDGDGVTLTPSFIGLTGPMGVLPRHYTHHVADREAHHRDFASRAFLDIFTTRAVALFYQSWLRSRLHLQYEADRESRFLPMVLSLAGLGLPGLRERLVSGSEGIADETLAYYSGALRERPQSVQWFARIVSDYFQVGCSVEQFVGQWLSLPEQELTRLGSSNCRLGQDSFCGGRVWDRQTRVRLTIGPMRRKQFTDFLPGGTASRSLERFFQLMVGVAFDCEVRLILDKRDVAPARLGDMAADSRLGWNGWLRTRPVLDDACDANYLIGGVHA